MLNQITKSYISEADCGEEEDCEVNSVNKDKEEDETKLPLDISEAIKENRQKQGQEGNADDNNSALAQAIS